MCSFLNVTWIFHATLQSNDKQTLFISRSSVLACCHAPQHLTQEQPQCQNATGFQSTPIYVRRTQHADEGLVQASCIFLNQDRLALASTFVFVFKNKVQTWWEAMLAHPQPSNNLVQSCIWSFISAVLMRIWCRLCGINLMKAMTLYDMAFPGSPQFHFLFLTLLLIYLPLPWGHYPQHQLPH